MACYTVAATLARQRSPMAERLVGDGLVPLHSALGQHEQAERTLEFPKSHQHVVYGLGHMALLEDAQVAQQLVRWFR